MWEDVEHGRGVHGEEGLRCFALYLILEASLLVVVLPCVRMRCGSMVFVPWSASFALALALAVALESSGIVNIPCRKLG